MHKNISLPLLIISVWALFCFPGKVEAESIHFDTMATVMAEPEAPEPYTIFAPDPAPWELSDYLLHSAHKEPKTAVLDNYGPATGDAISVGDLSHPPTLLSKSEIILLLGTSITGVVWMGFRRKKSVFDPAPQSNL